MGAPPMERAWSLVYLGRLMEAAGETQEAASRYRAALEVAGATEQARQAAAQGLQKTNSK
jgi:hypothetical protein